MAGSGWENFGDEIRRTVQDAVENQDFHRLNQNITDTVDRAMGAAFHSVSNGMKNIRTSQAAKLPALYKKPSGNMAKGVLLGIVGGWLGIPFGLYAIGGILAALLGGFQPEYLAVSIPCGVLSAGGLGLMNYGVGLCGLQSRFQRLVQGIGNKEYCDVKELAAMTGRTEAKTIKDLRRMSLKGWFLQPHFDESRKCFITSDRMYQEYMRLNGQRKEEAARLEAERNEEVKREKDMDSKLSPEARKVIEAGDSFIKRIRSCNDAIARQEISAKISHMEILVDGIFDRVEQNPESVSDVRKLMDYYLPTTIKLLEAYRDLDAQPVEGENIRASKQEIEATLDTLNHAFEKILDDLFHRTAWDVSSDISVLNTMLAREGLTEDGIKLSQQIKEE